MEREWGLDLETLKGVEPPRGGRPVTIRGHRAEESGGPPVSDMGKGGRGTMIL